VSDTDGVRHLKSPIATLGVPSGTLGHESALTPGDYSPTMDDRVPPIGTKVSRRWIKPSVIPDETALKPLLARFQETPRIAKAWLVGSQITPSDGKLPYESTGIALVLDPPLVGDPEADNSVMVELISDLNDASPIAEGRRGWLFVTESTLEAHKEQAIILHARSR
jgi:hypothetical protein